MGDEAFGLSKFIINAGNKENIYAILWVSEWEKRADATRKPVECAFGIIKNRFSTIKWGKDVERRRRRAVNNGMC